MSVIAILRQNQDSSSLHIEVDEEKKLVWLLTEDGYYEEGYDAAALADLIRALFIAQQRLEGLSP